MRATLLTIFIGSVLSTIPLRWGSRPTKVLLAIAAVAAVLLVVDVLRARRRGKYTLYAARMADGDADDPARQSFSIENNYGQAANVINNQAPPPEVKPGRTFSVNERDDDGKYHNRFELHVVSPYPAANLRVEVWGSSVESVSITQRAGAFMTGHAGKVEGYAFNNLQSPHGAVTVEAISTAPLPIPLEVGIEII